MSRSILQVLVQALSISFSTELVMVKTIAPTTALHPELFLKELNNDSIVTLDDLRNTTFAAAALEE